MGPLTHPTLYRMIELLRMSAGYKLNDLIIGPATLLLPVQWPDMNDLIERSRTQRRY